METDCSADQAARKLYEDAAPATAKIGVANGTGSGFFIGDGSQVVTNAHVVNGQYDLITVSAHTGESYKARIEKLDDINDLAILRLEKGAQHSAALNVVSSQSLSVGDEVYGLGHPKGRDDTYISPGKYENRYALSHTENLIPAEEASTETRARLEAAAAAYGEPSQRDLQAYLASERLENSVHGQPGSSGSPVVNDDRQVIGIIANGPAGKTMANYSWAVPSERLQELMQPGNQKFSFDYQDVSLFRKEPVLVGLIGTVVAAPVMAFPRVGGTAVGALSLLSAPDAMNKFLHPEHATDQLYGGMGLASTAGFVTGAALAYFDRTRALSRIAHGVGLAGFVGQAFLPRYPHLVDIKRTDGDTRPPFTWGS